MNETEWLACEDPLELIPWTLHRFSRRKVGLFAVACCRCCWHLLALKESRQAVEVAERYADRGADHWLFGEALTGARKASEAVAARLARGKLTPAHQAAADAVVAAMNVVNPHSIQTMCDLVSQALGETTANTQPVRLLRDVCNPFASGSLDPAWRTWHEGTIPGLAQTAYRERLIPAGQLDAARLAVLSDALEDAGCTEANILAHLRSPGPHVRGCWALDLVLGKS